MESTKTSFVVVIIIVLAAGAAGGYFYGVERGKQQAKTAISATEQEAEQRAAQSINPFNTAVTNPLEGKYKNPFGEVKTNPF